MADLILRPAVLVRRHRMFLAGLGILLMTGLVAVAIFSYRAGLHTSVVQSTNRLALQVGGLINSLEKYRLLTPLIARRPDILSVYSSNRDDEDVATAMEALSRIGGMSGAAEIELSFVNGEHLSMLASAGVGKKKGTRAPLLREDVRQALQGLLGRHLLINDAGRFYIFSSAVRIGGAIVGVVSAHVDLGQTDQAWALSEFPIVASRGGRVVLSNRDDWLDIPLLREGEASQPGNAHGQDLLLHDSCFGPLLVDWSVEEGEPGVAGDYVAVERTDPLLGWTFYAMAPLRGPVFTAVVSCVTATLFAGLLFGAFWVIFNRQLQQLRQRRKDHSISLWLERRVRDRTRELHKTQEGLIHSAKLAAIGQMSTVLSHEFNQPLAAIRSYSDNAQVLFATGKGAQGQDNLARIGKLVDRMASLSRTLKTFARKPGVGMRPISVEMVVDEAVMLMRPQARRGGVELSVVRDVQDFEVLAGHTRLEQVLINLIANALDALCDKPDHADGDYAPLVQILLSRRDGMGVIEVSDNGPGIDEKLRGDIFEPFVTSKGHGSGLGLGLPIAYNLVKGFGGALHCVEPSFATMVTAFEIALPLAPDADERGASRPEK